MNWHLPVDTFSTHDPIFVLVLLWSFLHIVTMTTMAVNTRFESPVTFLSTPIAVNFARNTKGKSSILSRRRCYCLRPLMRALTIAIKSFRTAFHLYWQAQRRQQGFLHKFHTFHFPVQSPNNTVVLYSLLGSSRAKKNCFENLPISKI